MTIPVEVKCLDTTAYYNAVVRDVDKKGRLLVEYEHKFKPDAWVEAKHVRRPALPHLSTLFNPQVNDYVEAMAKCGEGEPCGWWRAKIMGLKAPFYIITYTAWAESKEVAEKDILRPTNQQPVLKPEDLKVTAIEVPIELRGRGVLALDRLQSLLAVGGALGCIYQEEKRSLLIVGPPATAKNSYLVAELHLKQQRELATLEKKKQKIEDEEAALRARMKDCQMVDFTVDPSLVGLVIGKSGANIKAAEKIPGVQNVSVTSETGHIRIFASTIEVANQARAILEYLEDKYPVYRSQVGRIVGKNFSNIHMIEKLAEVVRIRVEDEKQKESFTAAAAPARSLSNLKETGKKEAPAKRGPRGPRPQSAPSAASSSWADMGDEYDFGGGGLGGSKNKSDDIINLLIVGTAANVQRARTHLDAHMEHLRKLSLMVDEEKGAANRLAELNGHNQYGSGGGGGGGGGGSDQRHRRPRTAGGNGGYNNNDNGDRRRQPKREVGSGQRRDSGKKESNGNNNNNSSGGNAAPPKREAAAKKAANPKKEANGNGAAATKENGKKEVTKGESKRSTPAKKDGQAPAAKKKDTTVVAAADGAVDAAVAPNKPKGEKKKKQAAGGAASTDGEAAKDGETKVKTERPKKNKPVPAVRPGSEAAKKAAAEAAASPSSSSTDGAADKKDATASSSSPVAAATPVSPSASGAKKQQRERPKRNAAGNGEVVPDDKAAAAAASSPKAVTDTTAE